MSSSIWFNKKKKEDKRPDLSDHPLLAGVVAGSIQTGKEKMHLLDVGQEGL
jgi:hypothetical protein